jgi:hypothetical protein
VVLLTAASGIGFVCHDICLMLRGWFSGICNSHMLCPESYGPILDLNKQSLDMVDPYMLPQIENNKAVSQLHGGPFPVPCSAV